VTLCYRYLGKEVVDAVDGQVEGRETAGEEAPPPPVVILTPEDVNNPYTDTILIPRSGISRKFPVLRIGIWDLVSGVFLPLDPESGIGKKSRSGSGKNIQDHISESLERVFWVKKYLIL
jgi:hypothetical protein